MFNHTEWLVRVETEQHSEQRKVLAQQSMDRVRAQLATLAGLGYMFDLVEVVPHPSVAQPGAEPEPVLEPVSVDPSHALRPAAPKPKMI